jgi:O-antigen/teichoic acid export membrane protein
MNENTNIIRNSTFVLIGKVIAKIFSVILFIIVAHKIGVNGVGVIAYAMSLASLVASIANFGIPNLLIRTMAKERHNAGNILSKIIAPRLIIFAGVFVLLNTIVIVKDRTWSSIIPAVLISGGVFVDYFSLTYRTVFSAFEVLQYEALILFAQSSVYLVLGSVALMIKADIIYISFAYFLTQVIVLLVSMVLTGKKVSVTVPLVVNIKHIVEIYRRAIPFALLGIFSIAYNRFDHIILNHFTGSYGVGIYSAAVKILEAPMFVPVAFTASIFPVLVNHLRSSDKTVAPQIDRAYRMLLFISVTFCITVTFFASDVIRILYGNNFMSAVPVLKLLIWSIVAQYSSMLFGYILLAGDKEKIVSLIMVANTILNIIINMVLIRSYSTMGAAATWVLCDYISFLVQAALVSNYFNISFKQVVMVLLRYLAFTVVVVAAVWMLHWQPIYKLLGLALFVFLCIWSGTVPRGEFMYILNKSINRSVKSNN